MYVQMRRLVSSQLANSSPFLYYQRPCSFPSGRKSILAVPSAGSLPLSSTHRSIITCAPSRLLFTQRVQLRKNTNPLGIHCPITFHHINRLSHSIFSSLFHSVHRKPNPPRYDREFLGFLEKIPQNTIFYGVIALNAVVFGMWIMALQKAKLEGNSSAVRWMKNNFANSWDNITSGRIWTPLSSCFSHQDLSHILFNGFSYFFMAQPVLQLLGSRQFLFLYLGGGMIASMISLSYSKLFDRKIFGQEYASLGASGAIYSIVSFLACVAPNLRFSLYGIIPIRAWVAVSGIFAFEMFSALSKNENGRDTVDHMAGILAGIAFFLWRRAM